MIASAQGSSLIWSTASAAVIHVNGANSSWILPTGPPETARDAGRAGRMLMRAFRAAAAAVGPRRGTANCVCLWSCRRAARAGFGFGDLAGRWVGRPIRAGRPTVLGAGYPTLPGVPLARVPGGGAEELPVEVQAAARAGGGDDDAGAVGGHRRRRARHGRSRSRHPERDHGNCGQRRRSGAPQRREPQPRHRPASRQARELVFMTVSFDSGAS